MTEPSFEIEDVNGDGRLVFNGTVPRGLTGYDGCNFVVSLISSALTATVDVYDIQPQQWTQFFADVAVNWKGWDGEKSIQSLEHHLRIVATSDALGHISFRVRLRGMVPGADWFAENVVTTEAGQLEMIAKRAQQFFG